MPSRPKIVVNISDPDLSGILKRYGSDVKAAPRIFCRFDGGVFDYLFVEETGAEDGGDIHRPLDLTGYLIETALGSLDLAPTSGNFDLQYDGDNSPADLAYNISAAALKTALELCPGIGAAGLSSVTKYGSSYEIIFATAGAKSLIVCTSASNLSPASNVYITRVVTGDASNQEVQWIRILQEPLAYTSSFSAGTLGSVAVTRLQTGSATLKEVQRIALSVPATSGSFVVNMTTKQEFTIACVADVAGSLHQDGIIVPDANGTVGIWMDVGGGGVAPAAILACTRQIEITTVTSGMSAASVATQWQTAMDADAQFVATVAGNVVTVRQLSGGARIEPTDVGTGFTLTQTAAGIVASAPVPIGASAQVMGTALGSVVSVLLSGTNQWDITFPTVGTQDLITVAAAPLFQIIYTAALSLNTPGIFQRFSIAADGEPLEVKWEISIKAPGEEPITVYQGDHNILADVISDGVTSPPTLGVGLNQQTGLNILNAITGYTGGGATNLDGIVTVAITVPYWAIFNHTTDGGRIYRLVSGTDAESSPGIIRPDDYNASTNAKVWKSVL